MPALLSRVTGMLSTPLASFDTDPLRMLRRLRRPRTAEDVTHRVVAFVTRELQHRFGLRLRQRHRKRPGSRPRGRILDGHGPFDLLE